ncbi:MAG TPA: response regulator [Thermoanaerobaculia bacterium]|jgi:DNA-binding response OmpR family regulator|nr:response regulator [Thermoanaerobaculia bacterium]
MSRILIIDDDPTHLTAARGILEAEGYEVFTQDQPFGSTNTVIHVQPDLVLLDVNMPALSGDRLAEVFRANSRTRNVMIVLHSSNDEDHLRTTARRLGLDGYVCKGNPSALRAKVKALLPQAGAVAAARY